MTNNSIEVFAGGWKELQHAKELAGLALLTGTPISVNWKPDGTIVLIGDGGPDTIREFTAVTPYSVTGLTETATSPSFNPLEANVRTVDVTDDGRRLWLSGTSNSIVRQLDMSTKWDVTTLNVIAPPNFNPPNSSADIVGLKVIDKERKMFLLVNDVVFEYTFNTPGDISGGMSTGLTIVLTQKSKPLSF